MPTTAKLTFWDFGKQRELTVPLKTSPPRNPSEPYEKSLANYMKEIDQLRDQDPSRHVYEIANKYYGLSRIYDEFYDPDSRVNWEKYKRLELAELQRGLTEISKDDWIGWRRETWRKDGQYLGQKGADDNAIRTFHRQLRRQRLAETCAEAAEEAMSGDNLATAEDFLTLAEEVGEPIFSDAKLGEQLLRRLSSAYRTKAHLIFSLTGDAERSRVAWEKSQRLRQEAAVLTGKTVSSNRFPFEPDENFQRTQKPKATSGSGR
ncbi:MAG: hypothetical protein HKN47_04990 [Pirellulaceae bacterium]|nr:hypothetical protein [Pirellulaceae bacterium]